MSDDLKPCPFCDCAMEMTYDGKYFVHRDKTCFGAHISIVSTDFARIAAWNTRADAATIKAAVEMMSTEHGWVRREKLDKAVAALDRLARLGSEPYYGNSKGNEIARAALAELGELEGK